MPKQLSNKWEYLAGVIDTEGSIFMAIKEVKKNSSYYSTKNKKHYIRKIGTIYQRVLININMTNKKFINFLYDTFKLGRINHYKRKGYKNDIYRWSIEGEKEVEFILKNILSFLIIKEEQAKVGLEALKVQAKFREKYKLEMNKLNERGRLNYADKFVQ